MLEIRFALKFTAARWQPWKQARSDTAGRCPCCENDYSPYTFDQIKEAVGGEQ